MVGAAGPNGAHAVGRVTLASDGVIDQEPTLLLLLAANLAKGIELGLIHAALNPASVSSCSAAAGLLRHAELLERPHVEREPGVMQLCSV